jgi:hypothetical protein
MTDGYELKKLGEGSNQGRYTIMLWYFDMEITNVSRGFLPLSTRADKKLNKYCVNMSTHYFSLASSIKVEQEKFSAFMH